MVFGRHFVFYAGQYTEFSFYGYIELMSIINNFLSQGNVFFIRKMRTIDHNRRES